MQGEGLSLCTASLSRLNPERIDGTQPHVRGDVDISTRARRALFAVPALALHVIAGGALLLLPLQQRPVAALVASGSTSELGEVAIDISPATADRAPSQPSESSATVERGRRPRAGADLAAVPPSPTAADSSSTSPAASSATSPLPAIVTSLPAAAPRIGLALDGPNTFVASSSLEAPIGPRSPASPPGAPPRTVAERSRAAEAMLRDPSRRRERDLGLGPEGPVLRALGDATTASFAPVKGRAVFRAVADATGMIVGIDVISCDGGRAGWANAAELAREALKGEKLRMPSTAKRAEMRIEIVSELKMPSGHDPGVGVSILGLPITKGDGAQATKVDILDPFTLNAFALAGDPVDIGAKSRRVVRTRLLDSEVL